MCEVTLPLPRFSDLAELAAEDHHFVALSFPSETALVGVVMLSCGQCLLGAGTAPLGSLEYLLSSNESACQCRGHRRPEFDP